MAGSYTTTFTYTKSGNLQTQNRSFNGDRQEIYNHYYIYNQRNLLTQIVDTNTGTVSGGGAVPAGDANRYFAYNGVRERVYMIDGTATPSYLTYDHGKLVREYNPGTEGKTHYRWAGGALMEFGAFDGSSVAFPAADQAGSPKQLVGIGALPTSSYELDAGGVQLGTNEAIGGSPPNRVLFTAGLEQLTLATTQQTDATVLGMIYLPAHVLYFVGELPGAAGGKVGIGGAKFKKPGGDCVPTGAPCPPCGVPNPGWGRMGGAEILNKGHFQIALADPRSAGTLVHHTQDCFIIQNGGWPCCTYMLFQGDEVVPDNDDGLPPGSVYIQNPGCACTKDTCKIVIAGADNYTFIYKTSNAPMWMMRPTQSIRADLVPTGGPASVDVKACSLHQKVRRAYAFSTAVSNEDRKSGMDALSNFIDKPAGKLDRTSVSLIQNFSDDFSSGLLSDPTIGGVYYGGYWLKDEWPSEIAPRTADFLHVTESEFHATVYVEGKESIQAQWGWDIAYSTTQDSSCVGKSGGGHNPPGGCYSARVAAWPPK